MPTATANRPPARTGRPAATVRATPAEVLRQLVRFEASNFKFHCKRYPRRESVKASVAAELARIRASLDRPAGRLSFKIAAAIHGPNFERKTLPFASTTPATPATAPDQAPRFSGYAAIWNNVDRVGDIIVPGAFAAGLAEFLAEGFIGGLNHSWDQPIARPMVAREDAKGLYLETGPIVDTAAGTDVIKLLRAGVVRSLSIGYRAVASRKSRGADEVEAYWRAKGYQPSALDRERAQSPVRFLDRIELLEVSPVAVPANSLASVTSVKRA